MAGTVSVDGHSEAWTVQVRDGDDVAERTFRIKEHARSWAAGQAARMGVTVIHVGEALPLTPGGSTKGTVCNDGTF